MRDVSLEAPGLFFIIPIAETVPFWIDTRVMALSDQMLAMPVAVVGLGHEQSVPIFQQLAGGHLRIERTCSFGAGGKGLR